MHDSLVIDDLVDQAIATIGRAALAVPGEYKRYAGVGDLRSAAVNAYGVADAANLLYTCGHFPPHGSALREGFVRTLQAMQNPQTGLWHEGSHYDYHCTAHCIAALELFDAQPHYPLAALAPMKSADGIIKLLEGLNWVGNAWSDSHRGAGVFASLLLTDSADSEMRDTYFNWLDRETDPHSGLLRRSALPGQAAGSLPLFHHLGSTFHYLFNTVADRRPIPHAAALVDTCLALFESGLVASEFTSQISFIYIDWVYCLERGVRQSGHRASEARQAMSTSAEWLVKYMRSINFSTQERWNDLHMLFGSWCALAELQAAVPGRIRTRRALKNVLDRRPFI
ncbi:hypothetical protein BH10PLA1_BH10PLA1_12030 [soil metagenome]